MEEKKEIGRLLEEEDIDKYVGIEDKEKLWDLLIEYSKSNILWELNYDLGFFHYCGLGSVHSELFMISKSYGFIGWLVENDKIDTRNLPPIKINYDSPRYIQDDEEILLMLLSISDTPIEDLLLYLK